MSDRCRYCGRPVVWAVDEKGTRQILDPKPPVFGVLATEGRCFRLTSVAPPERIGTFAVMVSHWATCSKAAEVKRGQAAKGSKP